MSFPSWAPVLLVEECKRMRIEAERYRQRASEEKYDESDIGAPSISSSSYWNDEAVIIDELAETLFRLLTHVDMQSVWRELARPPINPNPLKVIESAFLTWNCVDLALRSFNTLIAQAQTPMEKKKSLLAVASKASDLIVAISTDPVAAHIAGYLMEHHLSIKNNEHREDVGDAPSPSEYSMPLRLSLDCDELEIARRRGLAKGEASIELSELEGETNNYWGQMPLALRLTFWAKEAKNTKLTDLLELFVDMLQVEAENPPEIKQPGRKDSAIKPFLIRRLNEHMLWPTF